MPVALTLVPSFLLASTHESHEVVPSDSGMIHAPGFPEGEPGTWGAADRVKRAASRANGICSMTTAF